MQSDRFTKLRLLTVHPNLEKNIWEEWLISALERTIYIPDNLSCSQLFNKEVTDYFDTLIDYSKVELKKLDELYNLNYLDYSKKLINIIAPLIITLLKYNKSSQTSNIIDLIKQSSYFKKLEKQLLEDKTKPTLLSSKETQTPIINKQSKFYYNSSNQTSIEDKNIQTVKISKGRS